MEVRLTRSDGGDVGDGAEEDGEDERSPGGPSHGGRGPGRVLDTSGSAFTTGGGVDDAPRPHSHRTPVVSPSLSLCLFLAVCLSLPRSPFFLSPFFSSVRGGGRVKEESPGTRAHFLGTRLYFIRDYQDRRAGLVPDLHFRRGVPNTAPRATGTDTGNKLKKKDKKHKRTRDTSERGFNSWLVHDDVDTVAVIGRLMRAARGPNMAPPRPSPSQPRRGGGEGPSPAAAEKFGAEERARLAPISNLWLSMVIGEMKARSEIGKSVIRKKGYFILPRIFLQRAVIFYNLR